MDKRFAARIDSERHYKLKVLCAQLRTDMSTVTREAIDDFLAKHGVKFEDAKTESTQK
ncbi:hypothetical protein R75465_02220 [Paraburkholderia aspalathi]|uniref:ribbon-helix-helix domain-containing protein n=1 Tax=Paraburkholderia aspalathi TaxID=1324617 RepID=UPI001B0C021B|nr:ribbon-helix-helix domain-containing protein [Paraburkholderia aspalathi]CAE6739892.1 hypothetical protein R75465_02220 [Paraburkholderia aspalathi]